MDIQETQKLVNERDELEHRKVEADAKAVRYPKGSQKRDDSLRVSRAAAARIVEIDATLQSSV